MKENFMSSVKTEINSWPTKFKQLSFVQKIIFITLAIYIFLTIKESTQSWDDLFEIDTWKESVSKLFTIKHGVILAVIYFLFFSKNEKN
jgi:hypothetical protein